MKKILVLSSLCVLMTTSIKAQKADTTSVKKEAPAKPGPKAFKDFISKKAITKNGLFTTHFMDDKYYFDIPDSLLGREMLAITRFAKVAGGARRYGGEEVNEQSLLFEKGPGQKIFLRVVSLISKADSTQTIAKAVKNSYLDPIIASFEIKATGKDSASSIIDVTDFFKGDNQAVSLSSMDKRSFNLSGLAADRSYVESIKTYPINIEVRTVKTYNASASPIGAPSPTGPAVPAVMNAGAVTFELNTSILLLPKTPMVSRLFDPRVGYFADNYVEYTDDQQKVKNQIFAVRYRLEPKPEDMEKYKNGILVEPAKPIIYYIDPATPKKWIPYLIQGINDWNIAFEAAGWKNAIQGKEWPNDSTMSLEDARFSVIRYFASDIENAYGPQVHDPRSGEILESHIGWYHNVMNLVHDWYMIQTGAVDPGARKMKFDDDLMGNLVRTVSSHEVGHTLGLRHNMGSSSKTPVEKLRDNEWLEKNGHTASIMDYARFNYVAQPEDKVSRKALFMAIGDYDKWAIKWGYSYFNDAKSEDEEKALLNEMTKEAYKNRRLWFGTESSPFDPRYQTEDLGDNAMKASEYGIKNLKIILPNLIEWSKENGEDYDELNGLYNSLTGQFRRYMGHVTKNVGGVYDTPKTYDMTGNQFEVVPKAIQKDAVAFLNVQLFATPKWILDNAILNKISSPVANERLQTIQTSVLKSLLDKGRLYRLTTSATRFGIATYSLHDMMEDTRKGLFNELAGHQATDVFRRNLQKTYVTQLGDLINSNNSAPAAAVPFRMGPVVDVENTDVVSESKAQLKKLAASIQANKGSINDAATVNHFDDLQDRIKHILDPK